MVDRKELYPNTEVARNITKLHLSLNAEPVVRLLPRPRIVQRRLTGDEVTALAEAYRAGARVEDLAEQFGIFRSTVYAHLRREQVPLRPPGRLTAAQTTEMITAYKAGATSMELAEYYDVGVDAILRRLRKAGVARWRPGRA